MSAIAGDTAGVKLTNISPSASSVFSSSSCAHQNFYKNSLLTRSTAGENYSLAASPNSSLSVDINEPSSSVGRSKFYRFTDASTKPPLPPSDSSRTLIANG